MMTRNKFVRWGRGFWGRQNFFPRKMLPFKNKESVQKCRESHVNSDKLEFIPFNQEAVIFSLNGEPLKLLDQFIYFESDVR